MDHFGQRKQISGKIAWVLQRITKSKTGRRLLRQGEKNKVTYNKVSHMLLKNKRDEKV